MLNLIDCITLLAYLNFLFQVNIRILFGMIPGNACLYHRQRSIRLRLVSIKAVELIERLELTVSHNNNKMSLSPQKLRIALEAEIDKRIDPESPTKYDINFYVRKINRL